MKKREKDEAQLLRNYLIQNGQNPEDHLIKDVVGLYAITELSEIELKVENDTSCQTIQSNEK